MVLCNGSLSRLRQPLMVKNRWIFYLKKMGIVILWLQLLPDGEFSKVI